MNNINSSFLSNLSITCQTNEMIREDGQTLTLLDRILDFFRGKQRNDHFKLTCKKLEEAVQKGNITNISQEVQIEILGRVRQIQKKIKDDKIKKECDKSLKEFESHILNHQTDPSHYSQLIFKDIMENQKEINSQKTENYNRKLNAVIDLYSNNKESIEKILHKWVEFAQWIDSSKRDKDFSNTALFKNFYPTIAKKLLYQSENVLRTGNVSKFHLNQYLNLLVLNLTHAFKTSDRKEIYKKILVLNDLMKKYQENKEFLKDSLWCMDVFLNRTVFKSTLSLSEKSKDELLAFRDLFTIIDQHLPTLQDEKLKVDLKIKCANLPCPTDRSFFPHLFLSEKEQLDILVERLQEEENKTTQSIVNFLKTPTLSSRVDIHRLAKFVHPKKSNLSEQNLLEFRNALNEHLKDSPIQNWEDFENVKARLKEVFQINSRKDNAIDYLKRISKTKMFFQNQKGLKEEMILIPRWYHATDKTAIFAIIKSGKIEVLHKQAYEGAWVSTKREEDFGRYALSLSNKIIDLDPHVSIRYEYEDCRWRGSQEAILLKNDPNSSHLVMVGIPSEMAKAAQKTDKAEIIQLLKNQRFSQPPGPLD